MKKIGITEWYLPYSGPSAINLCRKLGFDGIEIGDLGGHFKNYPLLDERIKDQYKAAVEDSNFQIYSYHAISLSRELGFKYDLKSDKGKLGIEVFKKSVKICRDYSIPTIMLACFRNGRAENRYEIKKMIENLNEYILIAKDYDVRMVIEAFSDITTIKRILNEVEGLTLCYDLLNPIKFGFSDPVEDLNLLKIEQIDHIHIKDAPETLDDYCLVGDGCAGIEDSIDILKKKGYDGWYFLENHYNEPTLTYDGHGIDAIRKDIARVKAMW